MPLVWVGVGLVAGVGIAAIGPGGVLVTIALHALSSLTPAEVAGTALVTHVGTGLLGSAVYWRSGQLREPETRRAALILAAAAACGAPVGVAVNGALSGKSFGGLLGGFLVLVAALVWLRQRAGERASRAALRGPVVAAVGVGVAAVGGVFGVGGPLLTVPLLVALGAPVLPALAAAQVQAVVVSAVGGAGYLAQGAIDWPLAAWVGVPQLAGVVAGWRIAHAAPTRRLEQAMIAALLALAPYLAFAG